MIDAWAFSASIRTAILGLSFIGVLVEKGGRATAIALRFVKVACGIAHAPSISLYDADHDPSRWRD